MIPLTVKIGVQKIAGQALMDIQTDTELLTNRAKDPGEGESKF